MKAFSLLTCLLLLPIGLRAEQKERSDDEILKTVTLPAGYSATVFARPPTLGYPTSVSAAIDGTIFVAIDENGSLDRESKRGRVYRLRDTDGDGKADETKVFAEMDSPRGVIWDGRNGTSNGALYVMHPPNLTAYYDDDGDGKADRQEDLITGLGFDLKFRGADHTTNGCRLGIDGYIYVAVGDYGYVEAKGKDGTIIKNRGGGIVRVRTDGTGLEIVSRGQRNIYDVAISPTMDLFTRDNTNDGGGWNVRLSYVPPGAHMGYPTLFKNFPEDMLQPLADYGGGSPCGALWMDEPGLPKGLFTVEWGADAIMYHGLKQSGAGWMVDGPDKGQTKWLKMKRPTDIDVDASGRLYITSWEGATFKYEGPNAGYILRVVKDGANPPPVPDLAKATDEQIGNVIFGDSAVLRLAAQREGLRRVVGGAMVNVRLPLNNRGTKEAGLERTAYMATGLQASRLGKSNVDGWVEFVRGTPLQQPFLALMDGTPSFTTPRLLALITDSLKDANPRIRASAIAAARRVGRPELAANVLPLVSDGDPVIAHLATRALTEMKAVDVCLGALDKPGALRALYGMYDERVVTGLLERLPDSKGEMRKGILNALCRLDNQDDPYTKPDMWWGTRPDTSGPVYKAVKWEKSFAIDAALRRTAKEADDTEAKWLLSRMYATKVDFDGLIELMLAKAGNDTAAKLTAIEGLFNSDNVLAANALVAAQKIAMTAEEAPELRARSLRVLQKATQLKVNADEPRDRAWKAATEAFAPLIGHDQPHAALKAVVEDFIHMSPNTSTITYLRKLSDGADLQQRVFAQTILLNAATSTVVKGKEKEAVTGAINALWKKPESAAALLGIIARTKATAMGPQVKAHLKDPNNAVAEAALFAYQSLGLNETKAAPTLATMSYEQACAAVTTGGDVAKGQEMFVRAACIACHTVSDNEPPKGPNLAATARIYDRAALTESILKPNAKIAQGFETQWFKTKKGEQIEGFVTREGGDSVDVRNIAGQTQTLEKGDVAERGKRETSMMPEGLLGSFAPADLASLLAYLESLKGK